MSVHASTDVGLQFTRVSDMITGSGEYVGVRFDRLSKHYIHSIRVGGRVGRMSAVNCQRVSTDWHPDWH